MLGRCAVLLVCLLVGCGDSTPAGKREVKAERELPARPADRVTLADGNEVYYRGAVTKEEAQAVGAALEAIGHFTDEGPAAAIMLREQTRPIIGLAVDDFDLESQRTFHKLAPELSQKALGGAAVDLWLTDPQFTPRVKLTWETRPQMLALTDDYGFEVNVKDGVTEAEGREVARVLRDHKFFAGDQGGGVYVHRERGRFVVSFVVLDWVLTDRNAQSVFHRWAYQLSLEALHSEPVDIWLTNDQYEPHLKLSWESRPGNPVLLGNGHEVSYQNGGTEDEARRVGAALIDFFNDAQGATTVFVSRVDDRAIVEFTVQDWVFRDRQSRKSFHRYANRLSKLAFDGEPVDIWLRDGRAPNDDEKIPTKKLAWEARPRS